MICTTLDDYFARYGSLLGKQAKESLRPLHIPGQDPCLNLTWWRAVPRPCGARNPSCSSLRWAPARP
jgi:hypothetical protein